MRIEDYNEMIYEYTKEINECDEQIIQYRIKIEENRRYNNLMISEEGESVSNFSPRNAETKYRDEINLQEQDETENLRIIDELSVRRDRLQNLMDSLIGWKEEYDYKTDQLTAIKSTVASDLTGILDLLERTRTFVKMIDNDREHAKNGLEDTNDRIMKLVEGIQREINTQND